MTNLADQFSILREEINSTSPNVERCRDWCETLADLCEDLALKIEVLEVERKKAKA